MDRQHAVDRTVSLPDYLRLEGEHGAVVRHASLQAKRGREVLASLEKGLGTLPEVLGLPAPDLEALVVADDDWNEAPRDNSRPYPQGLPYLTRAAETRTLVIPASLSAAIQPRTRATLPLVVSHELAHAFLAGEVTARTPPWLRELPPQAASAAVVREEGLPLNEHFANVTSPGFTIRGFRTPAGAEDQMSFQNLLLKLGAAALEDFGGGFIRRLVDSLRREEVVDEARAEESLAAALGDGGAEWLATREEF
ncbi:hypothetical protein BH20ACT11_BH20ACT11_11790 [soil metagenome]